MASYIISDIHGCLLTLRALVEDEIMATPQDRFYFLGDYIDRGPNSAGVIDYILNLKARGYGVECILGNHEYMMLHSIGGRSNFSLWMSNAGKETIRSYGIRSTYKMNVLMQIPPEHLKFLHALKPYIIVDDRFILVHGGMDYAASEPLKNTEALVWNRPEAVPDSFMPGYTIIHGHTPAPIDTIVRGIHTPGSRLVGIDAGCVYSGRQPGLGYLAALNIDSWTLKYVKCMD